MGAEESFLDVVREHIGYILSDGAKDPHEKLRSVNRAMVHYTTVAARSGDSSVGKFFTSEAYLGRLETLLGQPASSVVPQKNPYPASSRESLPRGDPSPFEDFSVEKLDTLNPDALYQFSKVIGILVPPNAPGPKKAKHASCLYQRVSRQPEKALLEPISLGKSKVFGVRGRHVLSVLRTSFGDGLYWEAELSPALVGRVRQYAPPLPSYAEVSSDNGNGDTREIPGRAGVNGNSVVTLDRLAQIVGEGNVDGLGIKAISVGTTRCVKLRELQGKLTPDQLQQLESVLE